MKTEAAIPILVSSVITAAAALVGQHELATRPAVEKASANRENAYEAREAIVYLQTSLTDCQTGFHDHMEDDH